MLDAVAGVEKNANIMSKHNIIWDMRGITFAIFFCLLKKPEWKEIIN